MSGGIELSPKQAAKFTNIMLQKAVEWHDEATLEDILTRIMEVVCAKGMNPMDVISLQLLKIAVDRFGLEAKAKDVLKVSVIAEKVLNEIFREDQGEADSPVSGDERSHSE